MEWFTYLLILISVLPNSYLFPFFEPQVDDDLLYDDMKHLVYDKRGAPRARRRWPKVGGGVIIPYEIADGHHYTDLIKESIDEFNAQLKCGHVVPRTNEADYVRFVEGDGCSSVVGRLGGMQEISIGRTTKFWFFTVSSCGQKGTIKHELMHALGFFHEHQRPDRDVYITINRENIRPGYESQFATIPDSRLAANAFPYDYRSVMHYGRTYFSKDGTAETMSTREYKGPVGSDEKLSETDILEINSYFGCLGPLTIDSTAANDCLKQFTNCNSKWYCFELTCKCKSKFRSCCDGGYQCSSKTGAERVKCEKSKAACLKKI